MLNLIQHLAETLKQVQGDKYPYLILNKNSQAGEVTTPVASVACCRSPAGR